MARLLPDNRLLWEQLAEAAHFDVKELAYLCDVSTRQLQRQFQFLLGRSPQDWLNEQRLKAAQPLLVSGLKVKEVARLLGYKRSSHFCREFKKQYGTTASQLVALHRAGNQQRPQAIMSLLDNNVAYR